MDGDGLVLRGDVHMAIVIVAAIGHDVLRRKLFVLHSCLLLLHNSADIGGHHHGRRLHSRRFSCTVDYSSRFLGYGAFYQRGDTASFLKKTQRLTVKSWAHLPECT